MARAFLLDKECTPNCRSQKHVEAIVSKISKFTLQEFQAYSSLCYNWYRHSDLTGRTALHLAASCGKTEILEWILDEKEVDLNVRDLESGYTALHRAVYYGQLATAKVLIQYDSDLQAPDNEGLTPLDLAVFDRPAYITYSLNEPNEVSTWGENINNVLGHPSTHARASPDVVSEFKKLGLSIKQAVLRKYHSVFLTHNGQVFTCGHGQGGRLGHGDQHTVLIPTMIQSIKSQTCVGIAAGTDHTLLRMEGGTVLSCGLNSFHQLGQGPEIDNSLLPRQVKSKVLRKKTVMGICAGRFHSVVWTKDEIFAVGLNAGQLGFPKGDKYINQMQAIPSLKTCLVEIVAVTCSDSATAYLTIKGDVFVLDNYLCRRIAVRLSSIEQIAVTGGTLDHDAGVDRLLEKGGHQLMLVLRNKSGQLYVWRHSSPSVKRCYWKMKRQPAVSDVTVNEFNLIVTTDKGQAYKGVLSNNNSCQPIKQTQKDYFKDCGDIDKQGRLMDRLLKEEVEEVTATRIPGVHRGLTVASDRKGRNFSIIQTLPNGCISKFPSISPSMIWENLGLLSSTADEDDLIHDVIVQVDNRRWPAHRYIIGMRSHYFHQVLHSSTTQHSGIPVFKVEGVTADAMEQIIQFIYTDTCDFLKPGYKINEKGNQETISSKTYKYEAQEGEFYFPSDKQTRQNGRKRELDKLTASDEWTNEPVKLLQEAAKRLGIKNLSKRLNQVKCNQGVIVLQCPFDKAKFCFDRMKFQELHDVTIVAEENKEINCHRCILASRLDYFHSMLATGWMESKNSTHLQLPAPGEALEILIDFLYTDKSQQITECSNEKLLREVLIVSDQLLASRLKQVCEVSLANLVSFRNVAELLEFSTVYNADQLKETCQQFVCLNLSAVLEARILEAVGVDTLQDVTRYYRTMTPNVSHRIITPYGERTDERYIIDLVKEYQTLNPDRESQAFEAAKRGGKQNKRRLKRRVKSLSEDDDQQKTWMPIVSNSSDISATLDEENILSVDEINRRLERDEKKSSLEAANKHPTKLHTKKVLSGVPTHPEDVQPWTPNMKTLSRTGSNTNNNNETNPIGEMSVSESTILVSSPPCSSITATSPSSLRDIMRQESYFSNQTNKPGFTQTSTSHFSRKEGKKHRRKGKLDECVQQAESKAPSSPWGKALGGVINSFRDLMLQDMDKTAQPASQQTSHHSPPVECSTGDKAPYEITRSSRSRRSTSITIPWNCTPNQPASPTSPKADNPWQRRTELAVSPVAAPTLLTYSTSPPTSTLNFNDILQDEIEREETRIRMKQKPLALIQIEERAMQELLVHYGARDCVDEYITVERVAKNVAATPIWQRD